MSPKKHDKNKDKQDDETDTGSSSGGQGGRIEFRDFLATGANLRDDLLPFEEQKRLLNTHKDLHEAKVKQQKEKRDQYKDLKNGKTSLQSYRAGVMGSGMGSQYKTNPVLADKAQFGVTDRQVNNASTEFSADTNQQKQDELQNKLRLGYQPRPAFNPKPHGPG